MLSKMLKLTTVLFVLLTFIIVPDSIFSDDSDDFWDTSSTISSVTDKKCGETKDSERKLKQGFKSCESINDVKEEMRRKACENMPSTEYDVKQSPGCSVKAEKTEDQYYITYFVCFEKEEIIENGTVSCSWHQGPKECRNDGDYSITDKEYKFCRDGSFTVPKDDEFLTWAE